MTGTGHQPLADHVPGQLDALDELAAIRPVDKRTADLLALIAGDPLHADDRQRIITAIITDADDHHGIVDPNRVRTALAGEHGLTVNPRVIGAVYNSLRSQGVLELVGKTPSTDSAGGNIGKEVRLYRLNLARDAA